MLDIIIIMVNIKHKHDKHSVCVVSFFSRLVGKKLFYTIC